MIEAADRARPVALVSAREARALDEDLPLLSAALRARGLESEVVDWDDEAIDWSRFALALLRSTWDYSARLSEFMGWLERVARLTRLYNPQQVVRWSLDKHYLAELRRAGAATVPTAFVEPDADAAAMLQEFLRREAAAAEIVIKPAVSSGSRNAQRHLRGDYPAMLAHVSRLLAERRSVLLQPYLDRVDEYGETALMYFDGEFSHAIRKGPLLQRGAAPTPALFAREQIEPRTAGADELELGARVLAALPFERLLYARVDVIRDAGGRPCVLELELAEPSLFLGFAPGAAARLAAGIVARL
jgi:glutathione synthase/RimK-type ligase-like ATP-grasp enzyme